MEASLCIIVARYAAIDCDSIETFDQRYATVAHSTPALDIIYPLSNTLQRFAAIHFKADHEKVPDLAEIWLDGHAFSDRQ